MDRTEALANPCGDPPVPIGGTQSAPSAEGGALRSQDLRTPADPTSLDGTIIRVDPLTGLGAAGNPFASSSDLNARRVVAYGLRNPFRIAHRPGTDEIWAGDVGWGTWEEIDRVTSPAAPADNFGWPCYEAVAYPELARSLLEPHLMSQGQWAAKLRIATTQMTSSLSVLTG